MAFLSAFLRVMIAAALASVILALPASANAGGCHTMAASAAAGSAALKLPHGPAFSSSAECVESGDCGGGAHPAHSNNADCDSTGCCSPAALIDPLPALGIADRTGVMPAGPDRIATGTRPETPQKPPRHAG